MAANCARTGRPNHHETSSAAEWPPPHSTTTTTPNPHLLHSEKTGPAHHSSKHNFPNCPTEPVSQRCTAASDRDGRFVSGLPQVALPLRRMCKRCITNVQKKNRAIGATQAFANAVCVDQSWTPSLSMGNSAPPKPPEDTTLAFTPSWGDENLLIHRAQRTHRSTIQTGGSLHYRCCPRTQRGFGCVCGSSRRRSTSSL